MVYNKAIMKIDFENIKQNYPIVEIASRLGINVNSNNTCLCMFHNDNNPSMSFDIKTNRYKCFACDAKGSNIDLVVNILGYSLKQACEFITGQTYNTNYKTDGKTNYNTNIHKSSLPNYNTNNQKSIDKQDMQAFYQIYSDFIDLLEDVEAVGYLKKRKIAPQIVKQYKIKNLPLEHSKQNNITSAMSQKYSDDELINSGLFAISRKTGKLYNRFFAHRLIIPIIQNGLVVSLQARLIDENREVHSKYNNLKQGTTIFNLDILESLTTGATLIICEGIIDCLSWQRLAYNAIAIGSSSNIGKLDKAIISKLKKFNIYIAGDHDKAGSAMNKKISKLLDDNNIISYESIDMKKVASIFNIASDSNDINDILSRLPLYTKYNERLGIVEFCSCADDSEVLFLDYGYISREELDSIHSVSDIEHFLKLKKAFDGEVLFFLDLREEKN